MTTAVCTIITKSELAYARVLMRSVARHQPNWAPHVLLLDEIEGCFDPVAEPFFVMQARHLPIPDKQATFFFYDVEELRAAVKPRLFGWLFDTKGFDSAVFLDPRVWVRAPLERVDGALADQAPLVLTPHLVGELGDGKRPGEFDVLRWGVHDGGFVAMCRHGRSARELLDWWQMRSYRNFTTDPVVGPYRDQRWLDFAAGRWETATIRDRAYNVAYWNLAERNLRASGAEYTVATEPLRFFQFEGFDPRTPDRLSADDERFARDLPEAARQLAAAYSDELRSAGLESSSRFPYTFDRYSNGERVSPLARALYRKDPAVREECGDDPFETGPAPFNRACGKHAFVTRLMVEIWNQRPDLQRAFPDLDRAEDAQAFARWFLVSGPAEYPIGPEHSNPVAVELDRVKAARSSAVAGKDNSNGATNGGSHGLGNGSARRSGASLARGLVAPVSTGLAAMRRAVPELLDGRLLASGLRFAPAVGRRIANGRTHVVTEERRLTAPLPQGLPGLNIAGYVTADLGLGQSARSAALAAEAAGLDYCLVDFAVGTSSPKTDRSFSHKLTESNARPINLVHVNADQFPTFRRAMGPAFFEGKYTIGYWHWELPELPDEWSSSFDCVDEIWVPTQFVLAAVAQKSPVPVVLMPHAVSFSTRDPSRRRLGLPEDGFLFLTMYDLFSFQERKNPIAAIRAFRKAFGSDGRARLVIKVLNAERCPEDLRILKESIADLPGTVLLTQNLSRQDVYDLEAACDAFVAMHRSEGFGLGLAESMYLGKPVVATNWSGNVDFMTHRNSCPVNYDLIEVDRDHGPYRKGQRWADPDVEHAAWYMRRLVDDAAFAEEIGRRAQATMREEFSPGKIGARYKARLGLVQARRAKRNGAG